MSKFVKNLKGFTLVEVLIVIVIVGILIAALLPRLQGSQGRARDVARKGHIQQIATAYGIYNQDNATYPTFSGCIDGSNSGSSMVADYLSSIPTDPRATQVNPGPCTGEYFYTPVEGGLAGLVVGELETVDAGGNFDWDDFNTGTGGGAGLITGAQAAICGGGAGDCPDGTQYFGIFLR